MTVAIVVSRSSRTAMSQLRRLVARRVLWSLTMLDRTTMLCLVKRTNLTLEWRLIWHRRMWRSY